MGGKKKKEKRTRNHRQYEYPRASFDLRRSKCKLVEEMMFVNTYVKFRDNRIRNNLSNSMLT